MSVKTQEDEPKKVGRGIFWALKIVQFQQKPTHAVITEEVLITSLLDTEN